MTEIDMGPRPHELAMTPHDVILDVASGFRVDGLDTQCLADEITEELSRFLAMRSRGALECMIRRSGKSLSWDDTIVTVD